MLARALFFVEPRKVEIRETDLPAPGAGQVLVETLCSAISPGTEMLVYRGEFPKDSTEVHDTLSSALRYPLAYGYASVGQVVQVGTGVDKNWKGRLAFAFQPHASHFIADIQSLLSIPHGLSSECACFLPNAETAVNLVQDGAPLLGERVLVLGQGIVGLLTAALLQQFPLQALVSADRYPVRRDASLELGLAASLDPAATKFQDRARELLHGGADLTFELSGSPAALDIAIALTAFSGRIVIGSWYGEKRAPIDLGGSFHRSRIKLISSQVSSIAPELAGRWDKSRRFAVAWEALRRIGPEKWITHRFPLEQAAEAYKLLDESPAEAIQIVLNHG